MNSLEDKYMERAKKKRSDIRRMLSSLYLPFYDKLCAILEDTYWYPYKGLRTMEEQSELFARGREPSSIARGERVVTYAMAGDSAHNWGCATDWVEIRPEWDIKKIWEKSDWDLYGEACIEAGAVWGGSWKKFPDRPHNELPITVSWHQVGEEFRKNGALWVPEYLETKVKRGKHDSKNS